MGIRCINHNFQLSVTWAHQALAPGHARGINKNKRKKKTENPNLITVYIPIQALTMRKLRLCYLLKVENQTSSNLHWQHLYSHNDFGSVILINMETL